MTKKNRQQPLRGTAQAIKDLADTYKKNDGTRNIKINDAEDAINEGNATSAADNVKEPKITFDDTQVTDKEGTNTSNPEDNEGDLDQEVAMLKDQLARKAAELENFRRRTQREKQELLEYGNRNLFSRLLEVADNFDKAFEVGDKSGIESKMLEGFRMIYQNLIKIFAEHQVREIAIDETTKFDVELHEAVMAMASPLSEGTIMHVTQKGYMYGEKVLRHAKVVTSKGENE